MEKENNVSRILLDSITDNNLADDLIFEFIDIQQSKSWWFKPKCSDKTSQFNLTQPPLMPIDVHVTTAEPSLHCREIHDSTE